MPNYVHIGLIVFDKIFKASLFFSFAMDVRILNGIEIF